MTKTHYNQSGLGAIIILAGIVFLTANLNLIPRELHQHLFSWQSVIIVVGAAALVTKNNRVPGLTLIATGIFFLLPKVIEIHWFDPKVYWPMILIVISWARP